MKTGYLAPAALAMMAIAAPAIPAAAAEVSITATNPVVELGIYEQVEVEPDLVTIGAGVETEAPTAVEALRRNSAEMARVIELVKALGIDSRDIQTTRVSLNAQYDYDQEQRRQVFRGYTASNQVSVKLRNIASTGEVLDALVSAGANTIYGPSFAIDDDTAAKAEARKRALERGQAQAEQYARAAGYTGVRLLQVSESITGQGGPVLRDAMKQVAMEASSAAPPIESGLVSTGVSIQLTYEMVR